MTEKTVEKPTVTLPGTVEKIIESPHPSMPEKAETAIEGADELCQEIRIANTLTDTNGDKVRLKEGAHLELTVEAESGETAAKSGKSSMHANQEGKCEVKDGLVNQLHALNSKLNLLSPDVVQSAEERAEVEQKRGRLYADIKRHRSKGHDGKPCPAARERK